MHDTEPVLRRVAATTTKGGALLVTVDPVLTDQMRRWQVERGRDVRQAIVEEITATGSTRLAARRMGLSDRTLYSWLDRLGIVCVTRTVVEHAPTGNAELPAAG